MTQKNLGDDQSRCVGAPDQAPLTPAQHNDGPSHRPERQTGTGAEATQADKDTSEHKREHRSGYGGSGGKPVTSSDKRERPGPGKKK